MNEMLERDYTIKRSEEPVVRIKTILTLNFQNRKINI